MVYLVAFIAVIIAAFLNDRMTSSVRKSVLVVLCLYLILIIGFRYKVGIDTISYMKAFRKIPDLEHFFSARTFTINRFEPGYMFICSFVKSFTSDFWPVQLIMASITNICIFTFLYRYCKNVFVGLLFYFLISFFYFSTEIMRESAAVGIFLVNYKNLQEKKWLAYYLLTIPSLLLHYSAAIIWFFPLARLLKSNVLFVILCIVFIGITPLVERVNDMLNIASVNDRVDMYTEGAGKLNLNWKLAELMRSAFPAIAALVCYRIAKTPCKFNYMLRMQIIFCMGAFAIPLIFSRFANYTVIFVVVAAANVIALKALQNWLKIAFVCFILATQANFYYKNYNRWMPYVSIFYPEDQPYRNNLYRHTFLPWLKFTRG